MAKPKKKEDDLEELIVGAISEEVEVGRIVADYFDMPLGLEEMVILWERLRALSPKARKDCLEQLGEVDFLNRLHACGLFLDEGAEDGKLH